MARAITEDSSDDSADGNSCGAVVERHRWASRQHDVGSPASSAAVRHLTVAFAVEPDWTLDVRIAPEGALSRVSGAINRRGKRLFGMLKTENEFVGFVAKGGFEIWERQQRAVHGVGRVRARHGGSTIELRFTVPTRTRILLGAFFALYAVVAVGLATQSPDPTISVPEAVISVAGAVVLALLFVWGALRQRADLRAFLERVFSDARARE